MNSTWLWTSRKTDCGIECYFLSEIVLVGTVQQVVAGKTDLFCLCKMSSNRIKRPVCSEMLSLCKWMNIDCSRYWNLLICQSFGYINMEVIQGRIETRAAVNPTNLFGHFNLPVVFRRFRKIAKSGYQLHVRLSAWNNSAPTGRILMKHDI